MQRTVKIQSKPKRIVSLVPSQTELLHALGLQEEVVGITKFCIHPDEWFRGKHRIGGTKKVNFEKIAALSPDLIIGNKEENDRADIERLEGSYPVFMSDISTLEDALEMIGKVGELTGTEDKAKELTTSIHQAFFDFELWVKDNVEKKRSVVYLIWDNPSYTAGTRTFIDAMLEKCGLQNFMRAERYPELDASAEDTPDLVFLSSEPYPFKAKHVEYYQRKFPDAKVTLVDGELFSWYGSRLLQAPNYFRTLLQNLTSDQEF